MYRKLKIAPTPYCQCGQVEQTVSHILQDCPLLDQLRRTTWPGGATVRQKLWGCLGSCRGRSSLSRPRDCKCDGDRKEEEEGMPDGRPHLITYQWCGTPISNIDQNGHTAGDAGATTFVRLSSSHPTRLQPHLESVLPPWLLCHGSNS